ncbi:2-oxoglutarate dehydrogenase E1 component [Gemmatimonas sp.]|uniref:2-oxoglutarate dehydrogenase E1 component n=2 Tax=Gemmatimonas sp. TaxID=1962908 RepID=UPI0022C02301|nr:2-oxoglutarate dehydrogenase E1 component [Gemmatimonas sp.]MCZ8203921.1 2-oxoglutarate dehydrogenase E1 component [Gemmatimonas sp.]
MSAITSVFNDGVFAEQFERYRRDPASVDETWRQYFRIAESLFGGPSASAPASQAAGVVETALLAKVAAAASLQQAIRMYGHYAVQLDPLGSPPPGADELHPEFHGLTDADLAQIPGAALGDDRFATAKDVIERKRRVYSGRIGYEVWHLEVNEERNWFRKAFRDGVITRPLTADEKKQVLRRLNEVDGLERFLGRAYQGYKRFSVEGTDSLIPLLDAMVDALGRAGAHEVVIGMAHRGRLNVLTNVMGKPFEALFAEFEGHHDAADENATGDVKYHMGYMGSRTVDGREVKLRLMPNPSHLEVVNPVIEGVVRALQREPGEPGRRNEHVVVPVAIHGDAAFPGEGIVAETLNISHLNAYRTGGTIHIIVNNQVGFTTDPSDARSTYYASDLAKGFEIPIFHVNADDAEACVIAMRLACAYRATFKKDVLIDLVGYRRHGHNEGDEPMYTQPTRTAAIRKHPTVPQVWASRLVAEGVMTAEDAAHVEQEVSQRYAEIHARFKQSLLGSEKHAPWPAEPAEAPRPVATRVAPERLHFINESLLQWPTDFAANPRLAKQLERRRETMGDQGGIEWGHAEALAFGSLLLDGLSVRLTGQDAERGTFSHRHAVLNDVNSGRKYAPLAHLPGAKGAFEVYNSALSETAIMAFEYGYSVIATDTLTLWEAQFGDFVNVAQPIIDQFIVADRAKWGQDSGLVLLLPHGYEGQGPEHSSARLERFLQLCAEGNMTVAYCSTPAQYFHLLRRQALRKDRRPLVCMQPKSLLRLPQAASRLADLVQGGFQAVIDDPMASQQPDDVRRIVFCSGKLYYDLALSPSRNPHVALVRVEELYPWPHEDIQRVVDRYPALEQVVWAQEEPKNQGAWTYVQPRLRASAGAAVGVRYVGRPERASPAEGFADAHQAEQARIVAMVMDTGEVLEGRPVMTATY